MTDEPTSRRDRILADLRDGMTTREAAAKHGVSKQAIQQHRARYDIPTPTPPKQPTRRELHRLNSPGIRNAWSAADIQYVIDHQDDEVADLARTLGRSVKSIRYRRHLLIAAGKITPRGSRWSAPGSGRNTPFTAAELAAIDDPALTAHEVATQTGRSVPVIRQARQQRGAANGRTRPPQWTPAEDAVLAANLHLKVAALMPLLPGRSKRAIDQRRRQCRKFAKAPGS